MTANQDEQSKPDGERKRLTPLELKILHFIWERGEYRESIAQLSRDLGLHSDSNVNVNLNELVKDGYLTDGPPYKVTKAGLKELGFSRLPDYVLGLLAAVGAVDIVVATEALLGFGPINAYSTLGLGIAVVVLALLFYRDKRRIYREFLGFRKPL